MKILKMKPLTGREASVLALLARSSSLSFEQKDILLLSLTGLAKRAGKIIVGGRSKSKVALNVAKSFIVWAKTLKKANY